MSRLRTLLLSLAALSFASSAATATVVTELAGTHGRAEIQGACGKAGGQYIARPTAATAA